MTSRSSPADEFASYRLLDWGLLASCAVMWGSSFVFIEEGLEAFPPALVALLRLALGFATLSLFPQTRQKVAQDDLVRVALVGILWMAAPMLLFPIAQQWIDSSVAGIINGSLPVFTVLVAVMMSRIPPTGSQVAGIIIGLGGVVTITAPHAMGARATALGIALVIIATTCYAVAINVAVPLQRRYGSLPILWRAQVLAIVITAIPGLFAASSATFSWTSAIAMVPLGCFGTALAFVAMTTLAGRVGPSAASITAYFLPIVAVFLGVAVRGDEVTTWALAGTALVVMGAVITASSGRAKGNAVIRTRFRRA